MEYGKKGIVRGEMELMALREGVSGELVREEVGRGRGVIPGNIKDAESEAMIMGRDFDVKINGKIGN
ncbi:phosphomethylpyrimidine synthase ThiC, partial [Bacillus pumilus]|uniref:phosphomethylpyrimidine synthase ThiC n=1 Tax=Bacillus pumilus TaxID=1408 RepID=UPI0021B39C25